MGQSWSARPLAQAVAHRLEAATIERILIIARESPLVDFKKTFNQLGSPSPA